jgi:tRNA pseudouridine38-40 synthase
MNLRLVVEYDGSEFSGWQRQENVTSIQGELENALRVFLEGEYKKQGVKISSAEYLSGILVNGSGRTDAGVHAMAQTANVVLEDDLELDVERVRSALNGITPSSIVVRSIDKAAAGFDARLSPHIKCYCYRFCLRREFIGLLGRSAWCVGKDLDIASMIYAAREFSGKHDFSSFRASDCTARSTYRTILSSEIVRCDSGLLEFRIIGKGFLKQMVRIMAGTLLDVGRGQRSVANVRELLILGDRGKAGMTAPPHALTLEWMTYAGST